MEEKGCGGVGGEEGGEVIVGIEEKWVIKK